jgi:hypothetical protein
MKRAAQLYAITAALDIAPNRQSTLSCRPKYLHVQINAASHSHRTEISWLASHYAGAIQQLNYQIPQTSKSALSATIHRICEGWRPTAMAATSFNMNAGYGGNVRCGRTCSRLHRRAAKEIRERSAGTRGAVVSYSNSTPPADGQNVKIRSLWDEPEESSNSPTAPHAALPDRHKSYRQRYPDSLPTDVLEWLQLNKPQSYEELMDLRRALYARRTTGVYRIRLGGLTSLGEQKMLLTGRGSAVLILSDKARHFLLRTLCRLRKSERWPPIRY